MYRSVCSYICVFPIQVAGSISSVHALVYKHCAPLNELGLPGKITYPWIIQEKSKMSLEHFTVSDSKAVVRKQQKKVG